MPCILVVQEYTHEVRWGEGKGGGGQAAWALSDGLLVIVVSHKHSV